MVLAVMLVGSVHAAAAEEPGAKELFAAGKKAYEAHDYRAAAAAFEEAYRKKPHHDPLWNAARYASRLRWNA